MSPVHVGEVLVPVALGDMTDIIASLVGRAPAQLEDPSDGYQGRSEAVRPAFAG
jgi:hypothetical protein